MKKIYLRLESEFSSLEYIFDTVEKQYKIVNILNTGEEQVLESGQITNPDELTREINILLLSSFKKQ